MNAFKLALVTGASSGLGKALSEKLAARGIPLILAARSAERLEELARALPGTHRVYAVDLANPREREHFLSWLCEQAPDLIINNAARGLYGPALDHTTQEHAENLALNVQALVDITLASARSLIDQKKCGTIMNISSAAAFFPYPTHCLYAAAKSFVNSFSEGLDFELKPKGVRVLVSCPGQIDTPFSFRASGGVARKKSPFLTMPVSKAADLILKQIERGKGLEIIDWKYKGLVTLSRLLPKSLKMSILNASLEDHHF